MSEQLKQPIVFYDGDCGFCNSSVQFILNKRKRKFYFAALQSKLAKEELARHGIEIQMDTLYLLKENKLFERSSAALEITKGLKGLYPLMYAFKIVPRFIRDGIYNSIAKRRHRIRDGYCAIPSEEDKQLFLDSTY